MKMPKRISLLAIVVFLLSVSNTAYAIRLTYANFFPPTHIQSKLAKAWCEEVERATRGEVVIKYYPGGTLVKAPQTYDAVVQGIADVGLSVLAYSRGRFPVLGAVDLPMGYTSGVVATTVANAVLEEFKPREMSQVNVMYLHAHGPGLIFTANKPVKRLEDFKGLKLRATGYAAKIVKVLGGTPVAMSMTDFYRSIQKRVVDGGVYPFEANKGWRLAEVVDYGTPAYSIAYSTTFFVVMNKQKWNKISHQSQQIIKSINKQWAQKHGMAWDKSDKSAYDYFLKKGNRIVELTPAQEERIRQKIQPVISDYSRVLTRKNLRGEQIIGYIESLVDNLNRNSKYATVIHPKNRTNPFWQKKRPLPAPVTEQSTSTGRKKPINSHPEKTQITIPNTRYHALVIGNNDYQYLPRLKTARNDAARVADVLKRYYGFNTDLIFDATRNQTLKRISHIRKKLRKEDSLLIYYAGHGYYDKVAAKAYWLPVDSETEDDVNWIIVDTITSNIKRMASNHILIVADSCYSGTLTRSIHVNLQSKGKRERYIKKMMRKSSRTIMASGGNEPVSDEGGEGHSVFAQALIDGLLENEEKVFTAEELFHEHIKERVAGNADQIPEYNTIRKSGHNGGDFIFFRKH